MLHTPTSEQTAAIDAYLTGEDLVIEAGAGTGKTSTLQMIAQAKPGRKGLYLAFNKALQTEATKKFAGTAVEARTGHSLAYRQFGAPRQDRLNNQKRFMFWVDKAKILGVDTKFAFDEADSATAPFLARQTIVRLATETVDAFCASAEKTISASLVPIPATLSLSPAARENLSGYIARVSERYWDDLVSLDGQLPFTHAHYFKMWQLSNPRLDYDYILFDEAQDADPALLAVLSQQSHAQMIAVGDAEQAIYGWRGATNSMDYFGGARTQLTQAFRFGDAIAEEANEWLDRLGANLRLRGLPGAPSSVWKSDRQPEAILTRSNAGAMREVLEAQRAGIRVGVAGEKAPKELKALAKAALDLQQTGSTNHRDLDIFNSWGEVVSFSQAEDGDELAILVNIIEDYGATTVMKAIDACVPVQVAEQVISTAHVSKGLEWFHVRIADDFYPPRKDDAGVQLPMPREAARLAYVAVTRAKRHLDASGLDWAKTFTGGIAD